MKTNINFYIIIALIMVMAVLGLNKASAQATKSDILELYGEDSQYTLMGIEDNYIEYARIYNGYEQNIVFVFNNNPTCEYITIFLEGHSRTICEWYLINEGYVEDKQNKRWLQGNLIAFVTLLKEGMYVIKIMK